MSFLIFGMASERYVCELTPNQDDLELTLMEFLLEHGIPVASSCSGAGICQKCKITINNQSILSCESFVKDFLGQSEIVIKFSYL